MEPRRQAVWRFAGLVLGVVLLAGVVVAARPSPTTVADVVGRAGPAAPAIAVATSALLAAALVPRAVLATAGGFLFGPVLGTGYVLLGVTVGGLAAFGVARLLGREFVAARLGPRLTRLDERLGRGGLGTVIVVRLMPVVPFGAASYGFGATSVRPWTFALGTVVGAAPTTAAYAAIGAGALHASSTLASGVAWAVVAGIGVAGAAAVAVVRRRTSHPGR